MKTVAQGFNTAAHESTPGSRSQESEALPLSDVIFKIYFRCDQCAGPASVGNSPDMSSSAVSVDNSPLYRHLFSSSSFLCRFRFANSFPFHVLPVKSMSFSQTMFLFSQTTPDTSYCQTDRFVFWFFVRTSRCYDCSTLGHRLNVIGFTASLGIDVMSTAIA